MNTNTNSTLVRHAKPYDEAKDGDFDAWQEREWGSKKYRATDTATKKEILVRNPYARPTFTRPNGLNVSIVERDEGIWIMTSN